METYKTARGKKVTKTRVFVPQTNFFICGKCFLDIKSAVSKIYTNYLNALKLLNHLKTNKPQCWQSAILPKPIKLKKLMFPKFKFKYRKYAKLKKYFYKRTKQIEDFNYQLAKLEKMKEFALSNNDYKHFLYYDNDNVYTVFFQNLNIVPVINKQFQEVSLDMYMVNGEGLSICLTEECCIARVDILLHLNADKSWAELYTCYTHINHRRKGIASFLLEKSLEIIRYLQVELVCNGYAKIAMLKGMIRNFDNTMDTDELDKFYEAMGMDKKANSIEKVCEYTFY